MDNHLYTNTTNSFLFTFVVLSLVFLIHNFTVLALCRSVMNLGFLSSLQAKKLACYSFVDAGTRHETSGSETKNSYYS